MNVLVVDDDPELLDHMRRVLERAGYRVSTAMDGQEGLAKWQAEHPDLVLLDLGLPKVHGFEVCRLIRQESSTPIILLSGSREEPDIVRGLQLGADDYLTKPSSVEQLIARIEAVRRRYPGQRETTPKQTIRLGDLELDLEMKRVTTSRGTVQLTPLEFRLLYLLAANAGQVVPYDRIVEYVWGDYDARHSALLKAHVSRLRIKVGLTATRAGGLASIASVGYVLSRTPAIAPAGMKATATEQGRAGGHEGHEGHEGHDGCDGLDEGAPGSSRPSQSVRPITRRDDLHHPEVA